MVKGPWHLAHSYLRSLLQGGYSLAVVCVNNKQHLFNLNGNDGNNISIFNFQVI
jgi:hypothetical protein